MLADEPCDRTELYSAQSASPLQGDRIQPEFGHHVIAPHMNMGRLVTIQGHKEEPILTSPQNGWHESSKSILTCVERRAFSAVSGARQATECMGSVPW